MNEYKARIKSLAKDQLTKADYKEFYSKLIKARQIDDINKLILDFSISEKLF